MDAHILIVQAPGRSVGATIVCQFACFCYAIGSSAHATKNARRSGGAMARSTCAAGLVLCLSSALLAAGAPPARTQDWPSGPVRIIVPYAAGSPVDFPTRLLIDRLTAQTKGVFILENRPGAGGSVGLRSVVQAPPDGATFLLTTSSVTMVPTVYPALAFDPLRDLTSISMVTEVPISVAVRANHPIRDLADLIAKAKASPGKYTFGSGGVGTGNHLAGEMLKKLAGIDLLHVPYRGVSPALTALYAGDIDMVFSSTIETVPHVRDGRLRVLAVGTPWRFPELPDAPTFGELVPGYVMTNWYGLFAPRGLPASIQARLQA